MVRGRQGGTGGTGEECRKVKEAPERRWERVYRRALAKHESITLASEKGMEMKNRQDETLE